MTQPNDETAVYRNCRELERSHVCAKCGERLVTIYSDDKKQYISVCGTDHAHVGALRIPSAAEIVKRGDLDTAHGSGSQAAVEKQLQRMPEASPLLVRADVATGEVLSATALKNLTRFAETVNLKTYLGHVCLYHGHPYVTIDGYYYLKSARELRFAVITFPMTPAERISYQVSEGSHAFIARAMTAGGDTLEQGIGIVTAEEMGEKSKRHPEQFAAPVVHNKPQIMASKRAEWQLLQKMVPLGVAAPPTSLPYREPDPVRRSKSPSRRSYGSN